MVGLPLAYLALYDEERGALETLDFLINEWSSQRDASTVLDTDTLLIAQLPARIELPEARPGFFPDTVIALARRTQHLYNIPAPIILAQFALESRWGLSNLNASNYFGHTWAAVKPFLADTSVWVMRREKIMRDGQMVSGQAVRFASYKNIAECFDVHGKYLTGSRRYENALKQKSVENFCRELSRAGYAADPDYWLKLVAIIKRYKLENI